jgi:DNA polymerase IV
VRERGWLARTVGIKIRFADFTTVTRVRTLPAWTDNTATIYETAGELYDSLALDRPRVRLVGVKCENLRAAGTVGEQLTFDDLITTGGADQPTATRITDTVVDAARERFGAGALGYATLLRARGAAAETDQLPAREDDG